MKKLVINKDNLKENEIDEKVIRVKCIIENENNEIMLEFNNNTYQFPGGHREDDEALEKTLEREIREETGIDMSIENGPFMYIEELRRNYFNSNKNRCNRIYYFKVKNNEKPNLLNRNLTDFEKQTDFNIEFIKQTEIENFIKDAEINEKIDKMIAYEMLEVLKIYKEMNS